MTSPEEKLCIVAFPSDNKTEIGGGTGCHAADFAAIGLCGAFAYVSLMTRLYTCLCSVPKIKSSKDQTSVRRLTGHTVIWEASLQIVLLHCMNVIFRYSLAAAAQLITLGPDQNQKMALTQWRYEYKSLLVVKVAKLQRREKDL